MLTYKEFRNIFQKAFSEIAPDKEIAEEYNYFFSHPGKYIRPYLVYLGAISGNSNPRMKTVIEIGIIIELIHSYSLIHDDLPCMDNDMFRRNQRTVHIVFGEYRAVLLGDYLLNKAILLAISYDFPRPIMKLIFESADIMLMGQIMDMEKKQGKNYPEIYKKKTGSLFKASLLSGYAMYSRLNEKIKNFAEELGLLFQYTDDMLDITPCNSIREQITDAKLKELIFKLTMKLKMDINKLKLTNQLQLLIDMIYGREA